MTSKRGALAGAFAVALLFGCSGGDGKAEERSTSSSSRGSDTAVASRTDAASDDAASRSYPPLGAAWIPLAALCLAFFVEMVDNTLLSIALPTIGRELGGSTTALQWVTGAYSLTFGGLLLTAGSAADRLGRRRVLLAGLAAFGSISLLVVAVNLLGDWLRDALNPKLR